MVLISNDILSDGNVVRSGKEKGSCSTNEALVLPLKWKPREVSAVRVFPPGCGQIAQHVNVVSQEPGVASSLVSSNNGFNDAGQAGTLVESTEDGKVALTLDQKKFLLNKELQNGDKQAVSKEEVSVVKVDDVMPLSQTYRMDNGGIVINEAKPKAKFPQRRVSAVRDFPPFCSLNSTKPTDEEHIRINGRRSIGTKDECGGRNFRLAEAMVAGAEESKGTIKDEFLQKAQSVESRDKSPMAIQETGATENSPVNRVVLGLMATPVYPRRSVEENLIDVDDSTKTSKGNGNGSITPKKSVKRKAGCGKKVVQGESSSSSEKVAYTGTLDMVVWDEEEFPVDTEEFSTSHKAHYVDVMPLPFGPKSSNDARNKVRETLRYFQVICRKLLQVQEAKTREGDESKSPLTIRRVDLAARTILLEKGRAPDRGKKTYGPIPGVEVGDEFQYRVELALVGIHWCLQPGIDFVKQGKNLVAVSVVASGGYDNELGKPDCLTYSGSGGIGKDKKVEDQKLDKGNLALKNNIQLKIPVRVIRGYKSEDTKSSDLKPRASITYIYDGLYTVEDYWQEAGPYGNLVFKFELKRIPGQPELALREVKSKKFKIRAGLCADDISGGKEEFRICAFNTVDDEKPPSFNYITKIVYPDWYCAVPPRGCDCVGRCSDKRCSCAFKNGGEIPYNHNGAIVEAKPLVYECGPSCRCPPSCYNRVTQHGMKIKLEIFKTESRGWGVRSLSSIASGSFICEYIGELLEDTEAEKRTSNDEYLFDIGQNYNDCSLNPDAKSSSTEVGGTDGFTIDAANYGNVGRFINHSCSPNLYAQNVLYDQEDKRMPHIMLFAAENIPPLQELTYHYNYAVDTVLDSDGNIKIKNCYCGSPECTGRLY